MARSNSKIMEAEKKAQEAEDKLARAQARLIKTKVQVKLDQDKKYKALLKQEEKLRQDLHQIRLNIVRKKNSIKIHQKKIKVRRAEIAELTPKEEAWSAEYDKTTSEMKKIEEQVRKSIEKESGSS